MKTAIYIMVALMVVLLGLCVAGWWRLPQPYVFDKEREAFADSLRNERALNAALITQLDTAIAQKKAARELKEAARPPFETRHKANEVHFDTVGLGAAIDSLDLRPIRY